MPSALLTKVLVDIAPWLPAIPCIGRLQVSTQSHDWSHYWHVKKDKVTTQRGHASQPPQKLAGLSLHKALLVLSLQVLATYRSAEQSGQSKLLPDLHRSATTHMKHVSPKQPAPTAAPAPIHRQDVHHNKQRGLSIHLPLLHYSNRNLHKTWLQQARGQLAGSCRLFCAQHYQLH
jgi:hypothetical protein